jgi:hypothetical protein
MEGIYYSIVPSTPHSAIYLLRFLANGYVLSTVTNSEGIPDVAKFCKRFDMRGFDVIGDKPFIYVGAFFEDGKRVSFKVENQVEAPDTKWAEYDLLTFTGKILPDGSLQMLISSKHRHTTYERTYQKLVGNQIP